jgi:hypothetical protein
MYPELEKLAKCCIRSPAAKQPERENGHPQNKVPRLQRSSPAVSPFPQPLTTRKRFLPRPNNCWRLLSPDKKVRLLGISLSNFEGIQRLRKEEDSTDQLSLF